MGVVRRLYGAHTFHLVILLAALALTAYTISVLGVGNLFNPTVWWQSIAVWFALAVIAHDLILFPLYALADRLITLRPKPSSRLPLTNYVRLPTLASGLLLLMFLPGIIEQGAGSYYTATGQNQAPFLSRWLVITAVLYFCVALWYAVKALVLKRNLTTESPGSSG